MSGMRTLADKTGFTLIELMVVVVIIGVLSTLGLAVWGSRPPSQGVQAAAREIYALMQDARFEAIRTKQNVTITADGNKIKSYGDTNGDGASEDRSLVEPPMNVVLCTTVNQVHFTPKGSLQDSSNQPTSLTVTYGYKTCDGTNFRASVITNPVGFTQLKYVPII